MLGFLSIQFFFNLLMGSFKQFNCILQVNISGEWSPWSAKVPQIEVETHKVAAPDVVVPTLDTVRHESLLYTWLAEHRPLGNHCLDDILFGSKY